MKKKSKKPLLPQVAIIMGSSTDYKIMKDAERALSEFSISYHVEVVSAHRTPVEMLEFAKKAHTKGFKVIIAGAGGAAHLPGMVASATPLPVIGVPVNVNTLSGLDALLSIVQMPSGIPVATVAIDGAYNAGILAARMLSVDSEKLIKKSLAFQKKQKAKVKSMNKKLK